MTTTLEVVLNEVRVERRYWDSIRGGTEFDDANTLNDWMMHITHYATTAAAWLHHPGKQRENMVKAAATAVAAVEAFDRNHQFASRSCEECAQAGTRPADESPVIPDAWDMDEVAAMESAMKAHRFASISLRDEIAVIRMAVEQLLNGTKTDADLVQRSKSLSELLLIIERLVVAAAAMERASVESDHPNDRG